MSEFVWLAGPDCPLLRPDAPADGGALRGVQGFLDNLLRCRDTPSIAQAFLAGIAASLNADWVALADDPPGWQVRWIHTRHGPPPADTQLPRGLLSEVLDREAGTARPPQPPRPAYVATILSYAERANRALVAARAREPFRRAELEFAVAAGHYLGAGLEMARDWEERAAALERLDALVAVGRQLAEQQETIPLLEHIAHQSATLIRCERASIFLWDKNRKELVGRPALGLPNGELRLPDGTGIVGRVLHSGRPCQVDAVVEDPAWNSKVDASSGFRTRNLLCVPLLEASGDRLGVLEVLNKTQGKFTPQDVAMLQAMADQAVVALRNVREREALLRVRAEHEGQARRGARMIGDSAPIAEARATLERVARTELPVLILGESGTGKEVAARVIHYNSPRQDQPFLPVNCAAIAETLLESELFGHEKGAFTDAQSTRAGKFELAGGGTLFLDEIGDMSAGGQAKLLRVLEEKAVVRVGGSQPIPVEARIVAATNRNLAEAVRAGRFRQDLYYRLTVVTVELPALRQRRDDIEPLAEFFLEGFCRDAGRRPLKLSPEARKRLVEHDWPGNIRELRNLMERVAFLSPGERVEASDLVFILKPHGAAPEDPYAGLTLAAATREFEIDHIRRAIDRAAGSMTDAARLLGVHRTNLYRKMKALGMETA